jgi:two-component sensor histidine kinase
VPRDIIDGPLHRTIEWIIALTVMTFVLGLALARVVANRFLTEFASFERYVVHLRASIDEPETGSIAEVNRMKTILHEVGRDLADALTQQKALLDEVNHRVKNTLSTVQSIARLSRASSVDLEQYATAFEGRLLALADAYNLLTQNNWVGASLEAIVRRTLAPFAGSDRLEIAGPDVLLAPKAALALSAAIQELSTNAAKYGAFSTSSGKLNVRWRFDEARLVHLTWIERGGPHVSKPSRRGFGTKMITGMFGAEAGWSVKLDFAPTGLCCTMLFRPRDHSSGDMKVLVGPTSA